MNDAGNAIISDSNVLDVSTEFLEEALEKNPCWSCEANSIGL